MASAELEEEFNMSWTISENLRTITSGDVNNIVKQATYRYTTTSGTASAYYEAIAEFEYNAGTFTPFASLTEAQVIGWVKGQLGSSFVTQIEEKVAAELALEIEESGDVGQKTFVDFIPSNDPELSTPDNPW
jgi:hypothetical protein